MDIDNLLSELESVLPPKPEPPSVSPTPPSSTRQSAVSQASVQNGTMIIEEPRYEFAGRSTLDNSDIDLSKFSSLPKGPPPPKPTRSSVSPQVMSPTATKPPADAETEFKFPRQQSQTAANLAELDDLLNTLNQHQQKFLNDVTPPPSQSARESSVMSETSSVSMVQPLKPAASASSTLTRGRGGGGGGQSMTQELDNLMETLSDFKVISAPADAPVMRANPPPEAKNKEKRLTELDNMLDQLETDVSQTGVNTKSKGICAACNKPILGKAITAMNKPWHIEHFACVQCNKELSTSAFYGYNGKPYCERCYQEMFAPRCAYCNGAIIDRCMNALGKTWHPEHFFCTLCGKHFGDEGFHEKDGKAYCREDYYEKFAPKCNRCKRAIMESFITALRFTWHPECFNCLECHVTFPKGDYFEHSGQPYCENHYYIAKNQICETCKKPIKKSCVSAMGKKFHPEHFTCTFCLKVLNKSTFKEHNDRPYCQPCYIKLFG